MNFAYLQGLYAGQFDSALNCPYEREEFKFAWDKGRHVRQLLLTNLRLHYIIRDIESIVHKHHIEERYD